MSRRSISAMLTTTILLVAGPALASTNVIHVGGVCSTTFGTVIDFGGVNEVTPWVDQRSSMATATNQLRDALDTYCQGAESCYIYAYSNGGAVLSRTLSLYGTGQWNIVAAYTGASNEGGSELSDEFGFMADWFGSCSLQANVGVSDHRAGWNHHDTDGTLFYMGGGNTGDPETSWMLPGRDDGVVAMHSSGGYSSVVDQNNVCGPGKWDFHLPFDWRGNRQCSFSDGHDRMKMRVLECIAYGNC